MSEARADLEATLRVFQVGWNAHDAAALAAAFHGDATFVNRFGRLVRGRDAIAAMHAPIFNSIYSDSEMSSWVEEVEVLADDVVVGYVRCDLKLGAAMAQGPRVIYGRMLVVHTRGPEGWRLKAAENVAMVDPMTGEPSPDI